VTSLKEKLEQVSRSEANWEQKFKVSDAELSRAKQGIVFGTKKRLVVCPPSGCG